MRKLILCGLGCAVVSLGYGQTISITSFSPGYSQNFDSLTTTNVDGGSGSTAPINLNTSGGEFTATGANLPGWYYGETTGTAASYTMAASNGSVATGRFYSYGSTSVAERALGSLSSGTPGTLSYGARVVNNTGTSTGTAVIQFDLEQWRNGGNPDKHGLLLSYRLVKAGGSFSQADFISGSNYATNNIWIQTTLNTDTNLTNLTSPTQTNSVLGPVSGSTAGLLDGNNVSNAVRVRAVLTLFGAGQSWDNGDELVFRFSDINDSGSDHGFGIDNVKIVPEPASLATIGLGLAGFVARRRRKK